MQIGIPRERKTLERRVALVPRDCARLVAAGHRVLLEAGAGIGSGYDDASYRAQGVEVLPGPAQLWQASDLVVKVKEPVGEEFGFLEARHRLFCFLHLAAEPVLTRVLLERGLTAVGFELVEDGGRLPLLAPMSRIAGKLAVQIGAQLLHAPQGGKGLLLGGDCSTWPGRVTVLGAGTAGSESIRLARALGAEVRVFEARAGRRDELRQEDPGLEVFDPAPAALADAMPVTNLLVGAVLLPGARAPCLVTRAMVATMQPGSVIINISVDQGGCIETIHPTTYAAPTYHWQGVLHFGVTNMPGAVPRTGSEALSAVVGPWVERLATPDWRRAYPALARAVYLEQGRIQAQALREISN